MADRGATAFVTGSEQFLARELIAVLTAAGHHVLAQVESLDAARASRRPGVTPVVGNLLEPGLWEDEAASADWVFHLSSAWSGERVGRRRGAREARARMVREARLLDAVAGGGARRVIYVTDTALYGPTGPRAVTEDAPPGPAAWGRLLMPALEQVDGFVMAGLPIVTVLAGWVYGSGSWLRRWVIDPVLAGRRVFEVGAPGPWVSPIHAHDCARAIVHLADHGEPGGRYFVVDSEPVRRHEFARAFARHAGRRLRVRRLPAIAAKVLLGSALAAHIQTDAVFSNARLRGSGFAFRYPTLDSGLEQVIGVLHD